MNRVSHPPKSRESMAKWVVRMAKSLGGSGCAHGCFGAIHVSRSESEFPSVHASSPETQYLSYNTGKWFEIEVSISLGHWVSHFRSAVLFLQFRL